MTDRAIILNLQGGILNLSIRADCGSISSNLHYDSLEGFLEDCGDDCGDPHDDQFRYGRYEGAIDALESIVLAASQSGIDVQAEPFSTALQTALDAIGSNL
jgi:hypothetical protein